MQKHARGRSRLFRAVRFAAHAHTTPTFLCAVAVRAADARAVDPLHGDSVRCCTAIALAAAPDEASDTVTATPELIEIITSALPPMYRLVARQVSSVWAQAVLPLTREQAYVCHLEARAERIEQTETSLAVKLYKVAHRLGEGRTSLAAAQTAVANVLATSEAPPCELCGLGRLSAEGQVSVTGHYSHCRNQCVIDSKYRV